jgi:hypothetical protein
MATNISAVLSATGVGWKSAKEFTATWTDRWDGLVSDEAKAQSIFRASVYGAIAGAGLGLAMVAIALTFVPEVEVRSLLILLLIGGIAAVAYVAN